MVILIMPIKGIFQTFHTNRYMYGIKLLTFKMKYLGIVRICGGSIFWFLWVDLPHEFTSLMKTKFSY